MSEGMLRECVECGRQVSTVVARCPGCGANPLGTACALCGGVMRKADVSTVRIPHGMTYTQDDGHRREFSSPLAHQSCLDRLVPELFPPTSLHRQCPACGKVGPPPVVTDIGFPSEWTCVDCGHPCALECKPVGWCSKCKLPIVPGLHGYWSRWNHRWNKVQAERHEVCGKASETSQRAITMRERSSLILREKGDTSPATPTLWERFTTGLLERGEWWPMSVPRQD